MTVHTSPSTPDSLAAARVPAKTATIVALDREAARAAIRVAVGRFTALLRSTDDIERPAAGTDWTVAETAAHVSCM